MKNNRKPSIDGFIPRNNNPHVDGLHGSVGRGEKTPEALKSVRELHTADVQQPNHAQPKVGVSKSEIDDSLRQIDEPELDKRGRAVKSSQKAKTPRRKIIKRVIIVLFILMIAVGGFVGVKAILAGNKAFRGNFFDFLQKAPLKQDANGRTNILVFGTAEDDEGGTHPGGNLTDSIMVVSLDQTKKNAYMISLPRDLWVKYAQTCTVGNEGKLNAAYLCASDDGQDEPAGAKGLMDKTGEILGLDVQYYAHINFTVVSEAVDAVGGVDVKIESEDPRGIYDPNFDWKCNHTCRMVDYKNGEVAHLDGVHALALARARNAEGGYGLPNGNFDREKNQQKILRALQEKAISAGTLTNIGKVTGLIDALGNNLRTNFETKEIRTLVELGQEVKGDKLKSISLVDEEDPMVTTANVYGQSSVVPVDGTYDYTGIISYIRKNLNASPITREAAKIVVMNGSGTAGLAQEEADALEQKGFTITQVDNAPTSDYASTVIYQLGDSNTATKDALQKAYGVQITPGNPPVYVAGDTDFVVIVGKSQVKTTN